MERPLPSFRQIPTFRYDSPPKNTNSYCEIKSACDDKMANVHDILHSQCPQNLYYQEDLGFPLWTLDVKEDIGFPLWTLDVKSLNNLSNNVDEPEEMEAVEIDLPPLMLQDLED